MRNIIKTQLKPLSLPCLYNNPNKGAIRPKSGTLLLEKVFN